MENKSKSMSFKSASGTCYVFGMIVLCVCVYVCVCIRICMLAGSTTPNVLSPTLEAYTPNNFGKCIRILILVGH